MHYSPTFRTMGLFFTADMLNCHSRKTQVLPITLMMTLLYSFVLVSHEQWANMNNTRSQKLKHLNGIQPSLILVVPPLSKSLLWERSNQNISFSSLASTIIKLSGMLAQIWPPLISYGFNHKKNKQWCCCDSTHGDAKIKVDTKETICSKENGEQ